MGGYWGELDWYDSLVYATIIRHHIIMFERGVGGLMMPESLATEDGEVDEAECAVCLVLGCGARLYIHGILAQPSGIELISSQKSIIERRNGIQLFEGVEEGR